MWSKSFVSISRANATEKNYVSKNIYGCNCSGRCGDEFHFLSFLGSSETDVETDADTEAETETRTEFDHNLEENFGIFLKKNSI